MQRCLIFFAWFVFSVHLRLPSGSCGYMIVGMLVAGACSASLSLVVLLVQNNERSQDDSRPL
ncbi:hypothetical protein BC628DRAFT_976196 [Trametes gibbosa]|nr:hypothetical protein BC628DRAFT_976196 [Trametes gibbosa]